MLNYSFFSSRRNRCLMTVKREESFRVSNILLLKPIHPISLSWKFIADKTHGKMIIMRE